jgi:protein-S-isoprenylcysteine O-methyltransferase Ste14
MSNSTASKRILRWALVSSAIALFLFALAGRWLDPWLWAYVAVFATVGLYPALKLDDDLARERFRPPDQGADRVPLIAIRLAAIAHIIVGALDAGRWHLTQVPAALRFVGLVGMALALALIFRAMIVNRFFSSVVRIQRDRGHLVVDSGPYSIVRHPGYVGMIAAIPFGALAIGSWLGFAVAVAYSVLMLRRVVFEDGFLRANLEGYTQYAGRVRYRLIPGVW